MYCPECENIPLDKCGTAVCIQWKSEIADQIAAGRSEQEIIDGFVARFGNQVLGIPQDPALRNLALFAPYILAGLALLIGSITFWRWRSNQPQPTATQTMVQADNEDDYRARIERDLDL
jgi:cytochrome c-type biogenesis protein CcmH/NrfF